MYELTKHCPLTTFTPQQHKACDVAVATELVFVVVACSVILLTLHLHAHALATIV